MQAANWRRLREFPEPPAPARDKGPAISRRALLARVKQTVLDGAAVTKTTTYIGADFERVTPAAGSDELVHYIRVGGERVAIFTKLDDSNPATDKTRYLHKDHLGSIDLVTDEAGLAAETRSFDPWGRPRNADWTPAPADPPLTETPRGFTDHEHIQTVGLIHMNGRVQDPVLGRFISPDPSDALNPGVGFNRYSYALNNPLSLVDPNGFEVDPHELDEIEKDIEENRFENEIDDALAGLEGDVIEPAYPEDILGIGGLIKGTLKYVGRKLANKLVKEVDEVAEEAFRKVDDVGPYKTVGGHHVHAKAAFKESMEYDPRSGFSISRDFMKSKGWNHQDMTNAQRRGFKELKDSGRPNTMREQSRIAVDALKAGGASHSEARSLVAESLMNLREQGVRAPTNIPWNN